MNVFGKIAAGFGAVVLTATAVGLPDVCGYCTARAMAAGTPHVAAASAHRTQNGQGIKASLQDVFNRHVRLPI